MENELKFFLDGLKAAGERGFCKFNGDIFRYEKNGEGFNFEKLDFEEFFVFFRFLAHENLNLFKKSLEGFIHNTNGKVMPIYSRLGIVEAKLEEMRDLPDLAIVHRVFEKVNKSMKGLMDVFELMGVFLNASNSDEEKSLNLKTFLEGYYHAFITDRLIKHMVVFSSDIDENLNITINNKNFAETVYFLGESLFCVVREREESVEFNVSAEKSDKVVIDFKCDLFPLEFDQENLSPLMLKSLCYSKFFREIAEKSGIVVEENSSFMRISF